MSTTTTLLVKGADLAGAGAADLLVRDGVVVEVGSVSAPRDAEVIDADGLVALPGLVDLHTHLREPGREDAETIATGAAAVPLATVSASSRPGSRRWVCRSTRPGRAISPSASST